MSDHYCLQTKLQEGNVLTGIRLFTGGPHVTITHDALGIAVQPPVPYVWVPPFPLDIPWYSPASIPH